MEIVAYKVAEDIVALQLLNRAAIDISTGDGEVGAGINVAIVKLLIERVLVTGDRRVGVGASACTFFATPAEVYAASAVER